MTRDEMLALADACEKLEGGSDASITDFLDIAIAKAIGWMPAGVTKLPDVVPEYWYTRSFGCPDYTASLDAAMTLVSEGWWLAGMNFTHPDFRSSGDREWHAEVAGPVSWVEYDHYPEPAYDCEGGNAATPALALTAAALRAHASAMEGEGA